MKSMATIPPRIGCIALRYTCRMQSRRKPLISPVVSRVQYFHRSTVYRDDDRKPSGFEVSSLSPESRDYYNTLSPEERAEYEETSRKIHEHMTSPAVESQLQEAVSQAVQELAAEEPKLELKTPKIKEGYLAMGEEDPQDIGEDDEFEGDDITSTAHGQLEQHREIREYMRIAAWEMPMLSSPSSNITSLKDHRELIGS